MKVRLATTADAEVANEPESAEVSRWLLRHRLFTMPGASAFGSTWPLANISVTHVCSFPGNDQGVRDEVVQRRFVSDFTVPDAQPMIDATVSTLRSSRNRNAIT